MKIFCTFFIWLVTLVASAQSSSCDVAVAISSGNQGQFLSSTGVPSLGRLSCLGSTPSPSWFYMQVGNSGNMIFQLSLNRINTGALMDVDFILWGPFNSLNGVCNNLAFYSPGYTGPNNVVACSYSAASIENFTIPNAVAGQYYMLLSTNFSNQAGKHTLNQTGGTGALSSNVLCGITLGADTILCGPSNSVTLTATFLQTPTTAGSSIYSWYLNGVLQYTTSTNTTTVTQNGTWSVSVTCPGCSDVPTDNILVNPSITPEFIQVAPICSGATIAALPTTSTNGITGTWSPELDNTATTTYTFTPTVGQCANTVTQTISITAPKVTSPISFVAPVLILPYVTIGTQVWANKNLNISTYRDGTPIPQVSDLNQWVNLTTGAWCYYNNDSANGAIYGKLYNWYAVAGIYDAASLANPALRKQLAPIGWHVPSDGEWTILINFLDPTANGGANNPNTAGGKMKEIGFNHWAFPNQDATNQSGFTGLPGGYLSSNGEFGLKGYDANWWSSSEESPTVSSFRVLSYNDGNIGKNANGKAGGFSVRIIKD